MKARKKLIFVYFVFIFIWTTKWKHKSFLFNHQDSLFAKRIYLYALLVRYTCGILQFWIGKTFKKSIRSTVSYNTDSHDNSLLRYFMIWYTRTSIQRAKKNIYEKVIFGNIASDHENVWPSSVQTWVHSNEKNKFNLGKFENDVRIKGGGKCQEFRTAHTKLLLFV